MQLTQRAGEIRNRAKEILKQLRVDEAFRGKGKIYFTGSYALDLMTWNDIDMQLFLQNDFCPMDTILEGLGFFARDHRFVKASVIQFTGEYKPFMPRGLYLGLEIFFPEQGGMWKLDFWILSPDDFEENRSLMRRLQSKMTPELREFILQFKMDLMQHKDRVPQMGSHFLYQAILLKGLRDQEEIYDYLRARSIFVS